MTNEQFFKFMLFIFILILAASAELVIQGVLTVVSGILMYLLVWEVNCEIRLQKGESGVPETMSGKLAAGGVAGLAALASIMVISFFSYVCPGVGITGTLMLCIGAYWARRNLKNKHKLCYY